MRRAAYVLPRIQSRLDLFEDEQEVLPGIRALPAPGHTPGHTAFLLTSANESLLVPGDAWTHPVITMEKPEWPFLLDLDKEASLHSKRNLLTLAAEQQYLVSAYHFPWPGLGHVVRRGEHWGWEPSEYHWGA